MTGPGGHGGLNLSLLLAAQSYRECKKAKAPHPPQDWDGYGSHCHTKQHHTDDEYKNSFVKHGLPSFLVYSLFMSRALVPGNIICVETSTNISCLPQYTHRACRERVRMACPGTEFELVAFSSRKGSHLPSQPESHHLGEIPAKLNS